jgi:uncharacterized repeat protein (TIGR01451 family)
MKSFFASLLLLLATCTVLRAQTVTVIDNNFAAYLQTAFPGCISGNQLDTQCPAVLNCQFLNIANKNISNLGGITGFTNLYSLDCSFNNISAIITLPTYLNELKADMNPITIFFPLPSYLTDLSISYCNLSSLPALPSTLTSLSVSGQLLGNLPALPAGIISLGMSGIGATTYPPLNPNMFFLDVSGNNMGPLPILPSTLQFLYCSGMQLTTIPTLPPAMRAFQCSNNNLSSLPALPNTLTYLDCSYNQIPTLPALPTSLTVLDARSNLLTSAYNLPSALQIANLSDNQITCFGEFPHPSVMNLTATNNPFTCIPNYPAQMTPAIGTIPLCVTGNPNGCPIAEGIGGKVYVDGNGDCSLTTGEAAVTNAPLKLYDNSGSFVQAAMSYGLGDYFFSQGNGTWKAEIDTAGRPYRVVCAYPGIDSTVSLTVPVPIALDVNFAVECKPGFDVGASAISHNNLIFPGQPFTSTVVAGDLSQFYGLHCATGVAGQVVVTVTGPVTYVGTPWTALIPTILGNTYTYAIADFGVGNIMQDLQQQFMTDTTAVVGDSVCFQVAVTPTAGDLVPSNNTLRQCFYVVNSLDPNYKEVYPQRVAPSYDGWIDYTLHFQNTGNAPAFNIRLQDTLSSHLDWSTMEFLGASHSQNWSLVGNVLTVRFPNIMLPDSASDPEYSQGFFHFKMRPKPSLPGNTMIDNKVSIYFDFNAPVVTNTATTAFTIGVGVRDQVDASAQIGVYPNPSTAIFNVTYPETWKKADWTVTNLMGQKLMQGTAHRNGFAVDLASQPAGFYLLQVSDGHVQAVRQIVKQ